MVYYPELMPYFATSNNRGFYWFNSHMYFLNVRIENFHL